MERNLTVTVTETSAAEMVEECVTPTDPGSRIPPATVCPPAPRKRPSPFCTQDSDQTGPPSRKMNRRLSKVAIRLVFDVLTVTENQKSAVNVNHDDSTVESTNGE